MFEDIIVSKYSKKVEEFLKILEEKEGVSCSKAGQGENGEFNSLRVHKFNNFFNKSLDN